ncbi:XRE family transcriptional regulator [Streptomyces sp. NBC_00654]|uniref:telomere-protecting terminal protein Tpg n=1 Tax=Streptomyces sp. NBC_00654 TaxID=2975799 RepID=UPI0022592210|nr:XRE family transcriptional regulator [Streptomyces sp. NBC_00654]MCX4970552.1 XRE family transcriptional regulator [Streptomyces sp. NBC_00654]
MGIFSDSLDKATANTFTRPLPKSPQAQMRFLVKTAKGTRAAAEALSISQRTVERYLKGQIKQPRPDLATRLVDEVRRRWQPRVRERAKRHAATTGGIVIETRARFGFTAAPGTTDNARIRLITQQLPPHYAARLLDAHTAGATDQQLQEIAAEGLQEVYFKDRGQRAPGLQVAFTDIDYVELGF